jgi:hypothetical protein
MTIIAYLKQELDTGSFLREFRGLSEKDRSDLRKYAEEEMNLLGIEIKANI